MEIVRSHEAPPPTVGRDEIAEWLGVSKESLYNKLPEMVRRHGFPAKLPGTLGKWSRSAVIAWINKQAGDIPETTPPAAPAIRTLEDLYGARA